MASKFGRETQRIVIQLREVLSRGLDRWKTRRYDNGPGARLQVRSGALTAGTGAAIYLIHQPKGVADSTLVTCQHLAEAGFPALVVSNTPLSDADMTRLLQVSAGLLVRPNVGYDFGGYRDGLRHLSQAGIDPDALLILNDSVWFPLHRSETLLARLKDNPAAFQGVFYELKGKRTHRAHYESYFFLIRRAARESTAFRDFWDRYPMASARWKVLRRGEQGFSQSMFDAGFAREGIGSRQDFKKLIGEQDNTFLRKTLDYAAYEHSDAQAERDALLGEPDSPIWRAKAIAHIRRVARGGNYHQSFRYAAEKFFDIPFLKKNNRPQCLEMRRQYLRAVEAGDLVPPDAVMLSEIRTSVKVTT